MSEDGSKKEEDPPIKKRIVVATKAKKLAPGEVDISPSAGVSVVANPIDSGTVGFSSVPLEAPQPARARNVSQDHRETLSPEPPQPFKSHTKVEEKSMKEDNADRSDGKPQKGGSFASFVSLLAILGVGGIGFFAFQQSQRVEALTLELKNQTQNVSSLDSALSTIKHESGAHESRQVALDQSVKQINDYVAAQSTRMNELGSRQDWKAHEARYLIVMAIERLNAFKDVPTALGLLEGADERLRVMADPRVMPARQVIAQDILRMKSLPVIDIQGIWAALGALGEQLKSLELYSYDDPSKKPEALDVRNKQQQKAQSWKDSFNQSWYEVKGLVKIRDYKAEDMQRVLTRQEQQKLHLNLDMLVEQARWGVLNQQASVYQGSLDTLTQLLNEYYVKNTPYKNVIARIEQLKQERMIQELPDLSQSLARVTDLVERGATQVVAPLQVPPGPLPASPLVGQEAVPAPSLPQPEEPLPLSDEDAEVPKAASEEGGAPL